MYAILFESVLFLALLAMFGALLFSALRRSPLGARLRQIGNRRRIERDAALSCPVHGLHDERDLVRLPGGDTLCPECYQETIDGKFP